MLNISTIQLLCNHGANHVVFSLGLHPWTLQRRCRPLRRGNRGFYGNETGKFIFSKKILKHWYQESNKIFFLDFLGYSHTNSRCSWHCSVVALLQSALFYREAFLSTGSQPRHLLWMVWFAHGCPKLPAHCRFWEGFSALQCRRTLHPGSGQTGQAHLARTGSGGWCFLESRWNL